MLKGKKLGYLVYNFTGDNNGEESFYKILIFYDSHGKINEYELSDKSLTGQGIADIRFSTKEDLASFCDEFLSTHKYDGLYLISSSDFNIGMESGHNLQTFLEIFPKYGVFVESSTGGSTSFLSKIF